MTKHTAAPTLADQQLLVDIDLGILGLQHSATMLVCLENIRNALQGPGLIRSGCALGQAPWKPAAMAPATMRFLRRAIRTMNRCATARCRSGFCAAGSGVMG